ncbi:MAG TPA: TolC family protein [Cytophagaceae bacterium]|nr:TolC family protein [Cytophagaceae bacterium]
MRYLFSLLLLAMVSTLAKGQEVLQLEDVIKMTIENNFDIQLAKNSVQVADNNNNIGLVGGSQSTGGTVSGGVTGMLPQISISAGSPANPMGVGQTISTLRYSDPTSNVNNQILNTTSYAPSIIATWYFFDGLKMFATKSKLNRLEELSNLQFRQTVETTLLNSLSAYYQMISIQQYINSLRTSLALGDEQKKLADQKQKIGAGSAVDVYQTQIDYNNIQVQIIQQQNLLNQQKINLNNLLRRSPDTDFSVPDTIVVQTTPNYQTAVGSLESTSSLIRISQKNIEISKLGLKEFKGNMYPRIGLTGNYTFQANTNSVGFQRYNRNYGYNLGFIFSWTLLNNFTTNTAIKNQKVQIESDRIRLEAAKLSERGVLYRAYLDFQNNLTITDLEKKSVDLANKNLEIASQRFKQGLSNYIEYRTVQQSYEDAQFRLSQAMYNLKVSELNYLRVQGQLVKQ